MTGVIRNGDSNLGKGRSGEAYGLFARPLQIHSDLWETNPQPHLWTETREVARTSAPLDYHSVGQERTFINVYTSYLNVPRRPRPPANSMTRRDGRVIHLDLTQAATVKSLLSVCPPRDPDSPNSRGPRYDSRRGLCTLGYRSTIVLFDGDCLMR